MRREAEEDPKKLTRRDFARTAALAAATAAVSPRLASAAAPAPRHGAASATAARRVTDDAASARQAEIDARVAEVFRRYGDRLSPEQKTEVRRLTGDLQKALDKIRAYPLTNSDQPATVLHVVPDPTEARRAPRR